MIVTRAVLVSHPSALAGFTTWPVAAGPPPPLDGTLTPDQVGTVVALLVGPVRVGPAGLGPGVYSLAELGPATPERLVEVLLDEDGFDAPGGLSFEDTLTGAVWEPCGCHGLELWREWYDSVPPDGDPARPVRIGNRADDPRLPVIEVTAAGLAALLDGVQRDLADFLVLLGDWARCTVPERAAELVRAFDRALEISGPVE
ncbi:hypothetical protein ACIA8O_12615 [Kitasatospora sp. NPDC051853]|uniref:hypothetical protein n=1 Tax=Kitasatospora sp. NPDC051853 TaxID=3364058 RepID=UPI00379E9D48